MKKEPKKKLIITLISIFLLVLAVFLIIFIKYTPENTNKPEVTPIEANISDKNISDNYVIDVIDGDTFKLENKETVRLICIDSPEKGRKGYEEAKEFLTGMILDKEVRLEKDVDDKDEYGRLLRYVYVNMSGVEFFVNKQLVQEGYAGIFRYANNTRRCGEIEGV